MCNVIMVEEIVSVTDGRETVTIFPFFICIFFGFVCRLVVCFIRNYAVVPYTPDRVQKKIFAGIHFDELLQTETDHSSIQFNL